MVSTILRCQQKRKEHVITHFLRNIPTPLNGAFLMVCAGALFAAANTMVQHGVMNLSIPSTQMAFWQYVVAFLFALPIVVRLGLRNLKTNHLFKHISRVFLAAAGVQLWVMGLAYVPIWQAIALIMLSPFFVTLGAGLILRETISPQRIGAVLAGFAGGMIILAPWSDRFSLYMFLPVGASALWAGASLLTKYLSTEESPEKLTVYLLLLLTPINATLALGDGIAIDFGISGYVLVGAGVATGLAQYALAKAYSLADASYLQPFDHVKLPINVGLGILAFGFVPPGSMWFGSALIVSASMYHLRKEGSLARS